MYVSILLQIRLFVRLFACTCLYYYRQGCQYVCLRVRVYIITDKAASASVCVYLSILLQIRLHVRLFACTCLSYYR